MLLGSVTSSPVAVARTEVARVVAKRAISPDLVLVAAREGISRPEPRQDTQQVNLPAGQALDLFYRYSLIKCTLKLFLNMLLMLFLLFCSSG